MSENQILRAACVQLRSGIDIDENIRCASELIVAAAAEGAKLIATPETTHLMQLSTKPLFSKIVPQDQDRGLKAFQELSDRLDVWLLIGSLAIRLADDKAANRSFLIGPDGAVKATYDKIHMFDVDLDGGESYRESKNYRPGSRAVVADVPWGLLGFSICYDLRFAALYRALAKAGANIITIPAAFTKPTGRAHWHTLIRARAIETGCFVLAPAQGGTHEDKRKTYGHSLIVAPWGEILTEADEEPCFVTADLEIGQTDASRTRIPALQHDREFALEKA